MKTSPTHGDVLIRAYAGSNATTHEQIAIIGDLQTAVLMARDRGRAVWRENVDDRGRPLGSPVLLLPRPSAGRSV